MKTSKFTDRQIVILLKQAESNTPDTTLYRAHNISKQAIWHNLLTSSPP